MKPIRLSNHARTYFSIRGFTEHEVVKAIQTEEWKPIQSEEKKFECSMEIGFNSVWNGKSYKTKRIRPIFQERDLEIVVITVYTYYY